MASSVAFSRLRRIFSISQRIIVQTSQYPPKNISTNNLLQPVRYYVKGKDRKKEVKRNKHVAFNENLVSQVLDVQDIQQEFNALVDKMKADFAKHVSLRSSITSLDRLPIVHEGNQYALQDLAQIGRKNPNMYVISMAVFPQAIPDVLKAIQESGLQLNPQQEGTTLYIPVPKVTKEHREALAKGAKAIFVKTKDHIRDLQNKYVKKVKNQEGISEDVFFTVKEQITALADVKINDAEVLLKFKQQELIGS